MLDVAPQKPLRADEPVTQNDELGLRGVTASNPAGAAGIETRVRCWGGLAAAAQGGRESCLRARVALNSSSICRPRLALLGPHRPWPLLSQCPSSLRVSVSSTDTGASVGRTDARKIKVTLGSVVAADLDIGRYGARLSDYRKTSIQLAWRDFLSRCARGFRRACPGRKGVFDSAPASKAV
jgi:hypothetical protein